MPAGEGIEVTWSHSWPWPPWITVLGLILAAIYVARIYLRERADARRGVKLSLAVIRILLVVLVVSMMYGWMQHRHRTDLPDVLVLIDDSQSMNTEDQYDSRTLASLRQRLRTTGLASTDRLNLVKLLLLEDQGKLLEALQDRYNLKVYRIGRTAQREGSDDNLPQVLQDLEATQTTSQLGKNLRELLEAQRGLPTAAVVMFTDGVTTEGPTIGEIAEYARRKAIPLFLVGLGNDRPPRDLRLHDLLVDDVVFVDDLVHFDVKLTATGYVGQKVMLTLRQDDQPSPLTEQEATVGEDGSTQTVRLSYRPPEQGDFRFLVEAAVLPEEASRQNNRVSAMVSVRDETIRVLYVQEYPSHEFRFLKNMLGRSLSRGGDKAIELTTVLQEADLEYSQLDETAQRVFPVSRDDLFTYDVIIFGDVNPSYLSRSVMEGLVDFVKQRGGGVVFVAGPRHTPLAYRDTPLEQLFPINLDTASQPAEGLLLDRAFPVQPTQLGMMSPAMQLADSPAASLEIWRRLPGIRWFLAAPDLPTGVRVLAVHPLQTGNTGQNLPIICMRFVGAGKVIFHATDESYLWSRLQGNDTYWQRYWIQTIRYLSRAKLLGGDRGVEMPVDRDRYFQGEPVRLQVRFFDDRLAPAEDDGVTVILQREGSRRRQVNLRRNSGRRGVFESVVNNLPEGDYRAWMATPSTTSNPPARQFSVVPPPGEQARLEMDKVDLKLAAEVSRGRFYSLSDANRLLDELPRGRQVRIESLPASPVWNSAWLAGLFVVLIVTEWLLRKRAGML